MGGKGSGRKKPEEGSGKKRVLCSGCGRSMEPNKVGTWAMPKSLDAEDLTTEYACTYDCYVVWRQKSGLKPPWPPI